MDSYIEGTTFILTLFIKLFILSNEYQDCVIFCIFNISLYIYILLFALYVFILKKDYKSILGILPFITLFITVLLGPVAILRYILPIVLSAPLLIHLIVKKK